MFKLLTRSSDRISK